MSKLNARIVSVARAARKRANLQSRHSERGQLLPFLGLAIIAILGIVALVVDLGGWQNEHRSEQSAADGAAVAAAVQQNFPTLASASVTAQTVAIASAAQNGFTDGADGVQISVNTAPVPAPDSRATSYPAGTAVEVKVKKLNNQFFSSIFGTNFGSSEARAVAVAQRSKAGACLYQLAVDGSLGISKNSNRPVITNDCGVIANGNIAVSAGFLDNDVDKPPYKKTKSVGYLKSTNVGTAIPFSTILTYALPAPAADPCPRISGCAYIASHPIPLQSDSSATIPDSAGNVTSKGASFTVVTGCSGSGASCSFGPGLYYVYGGIGGAIRTDHATLVNVDGSFDSIGGGSVDFVPPDPGSPTAGISYYQPPSTNLNATISIRGHGGTGSAFDGLFYAPNAFIDVRGGSITFAYLAVGQIQQKGGGAGNGITIDPTLNGFNKTSAVLTDVFPINVVLSE